MDIIPDFSRSCRQWRPGTFTAKVIGYKHMVSRRNNPYIQWELEIIDGLGEPVVVYFNTVWSGRGVDYFRDLIDATGATCSDGKFDPEVCLGKRVSVTLSDMHLSDGTVSRYPKVERVRRLPPSSIWLKEQ